MKPDAIVTPELPKSGYPLLRYTTSLTPNQPVTIQAFPRDGNGLDKDFNPATTRPARKSTL